LGVVENQIEAYRKFNRGLIILYFDPGNDDRTNVYRAIAFPDFPLE